MVTIGVAIVVVMFAVNTLALDQSVWFRSKPC